MYIYRLEDPEGNGPYAKEQTICMYLNPHNDPTEPHMLKSIRHTRKQFDADADRYEFAWATQKKARDFVKSGKRNLVAMLGWKINCYSVPKHSTIRFHDGQVMFRRERAVLENPLALFEGEAMSYSSKPSRAELYREVLAEDAARNEKIGALLKEHNKLLDYIREHEGICAQEQEGDTSAVDVVIRYLESLKQQANEPLLCDYCECEISYHPWHGSGIIDGVAHKHLHACNDCRTKLPTPDMRYVWVNIAGDEKGGFSDSWDARTQKTFNLEKDALDYMAEHPESKSFKLIEYRCLTDAEFELNRFMRLR